MLDRISEYTVYSIFIPSVILSILVLIKGVVNFSRTGPGIKSEILKSYRLYSVYALLRLFLFVFVISSFLSCVGFLIYFSFIILYNSNYSLFYSLLVSVLTISFLLFVQFCKNLFYLPANIVQSSQYSMTKFYKLWNSLSTGKIILMDWGSKCIIALLIILAGTKLLQEDLFNPVFFFIPLLFVLSILILSYLPLNLLSILSSIKPLTHNFPEPNIIMIGSDTLRKDRVGHIRNGQSITPNIDKLIKQSISFENCFVPIARTAPSLLTFFSGVLPWRHKIRDNFSKSKDCNLDVKSLAHVLKNSGYTTAVVSDWCGTDLAKFDLGFQWQDLPDDQWNLRYFIRQGPKDIRLFLSLFLQNHFGRLLLPEIFYLGGVPKGKYLIQRSKSWITQLSRQKQPFFLNIFLGTTHPPFGSEYPYYSKYADPNYWGESKFSMARLTEPEEIIRSQKEPKEAFDLDQIIDLYDGTVTNFDDQVAGILASIKANKIEDNTIVIIYSDHGMEFFENDTWGQGNSVLSDLSYKVPLIIYNPQWQMAKKIEQNVRSVDLLPTLLDILNIKNTENYDGQSLIDLIENNIPKELDVFAETGIWFSKPPGMSKNHLHYPELLDLIDITDDGTLVLKADLKDQIYNAKDKMLISGQWKLVCQPTLDGNRFYLFDRIKDPTNKKDVSGKYPDIFKLMKDKLSDKLGG